MFEVLAHADLSHQLVLVAVHSSQLAHVCKDVLDPVRQLETNKDLLLDNHRTATASPSNTALQYTDDLITHTRHH